MKRSIAILFLLATLAHSHSQSVISRPVPYFTSFSFFLQTNVDANSWRLAIGCPDTNNFIPSSASNNFFLVADTNNFIPSSASNNFFLVADTNNFIPSSASNGYARATNTALFDTATLTGSSLLVTNATNISIHLYPPDASSAAIDFDVMPISESETPVWSLRSDATNAFVLFDGSAQAEVFHVTGSGPIDFSSPIAIHTTNTLDASDGIFAITGAADILSITNANTTTGQLDIGAVGAINIASETQSTYIRGTAQIDILNISDHINMGGVWFSDGSGNVHIGAENTWDMDWTNTVDGGSIFYINGYGYGNILASAPFESTNTSTFRGTFTNLCDFAYATNAVDGNGTNFHSGTTNFTYAYWFTNTPARATLEVTWRLYQASGAGAYTEIELYRILPDGSTNVMCARMGVDTPSAADLHEVPMSVKLGPNMPWSVSIIQGTNMANIKPGSFLITSE